MLMSPFEPEANSQAIYQRMQTEREQEATQIRALGEQQARRIRAEADRTATVIVAEAQRQSDETRGAGEAQRNNVLAEAFNADPDFFAFYRSMEAYQQGLGNTDTRWVISPDSQFFRYFNNSTRADGAPLPVAEAPGPDAVTPAEPEATPEAPAVVTPEPPAEVAPAPVEDTTTAPTPAPEATDDEPVTVQ